jgi:hypothetical protein
VVCFLYDIAMHVLRLVLVPPLFHMTPNARAICAVQENRYLGSVAG